MNRFRNLPSYHYEDNLDGVLKKSIKKTLKNYKVYGESVQQSKNLLTLTSYEGIVDWGTNDKNTMNKVIVEPNTDYTISFQNFERIDVDSGGTIVIYVYNNSSLSEENNGRVAFITINSNGSSEPTITSGTINSGDNTELYFIIRNNNGKQTRIKIYGMMLEKGNVATEYVPPIPTYDNPIEIESVGDRTKNYLDIEHLGDINNWDAVPVYASYEMTLPNGDYYFNFETELTTYSGHILFLSKKKSTSSSPVATLINGYNGIQAKQGNFTVSDNEKIYFNWHCGSRNQTNLTKLIDDVLNNFIIEAGDSFTGYEPYGYKIPIKITNTIYDFTSEKIDKHIYNANNDKRYGFDLGVLEEGQYTFDFEYDNKPTYIYLREKKIDGTYATMYITTSPSEKPKNPLTFTANGTSNFYIAFASASIDTIEKANTLWQRVKKAYLQKGTSIKRNIVNIYLNEPLRKIGETSDYIDFVKQKVIRNIGTTTLDGTLVWSTYGTNEKYYGYMRDLDVVSKTVSGIKCLCNRSKGLRGYGNVWYGRELGCYAGLMSSAATKTHFCISSEKPTLAEFRAEITEKPLDIIYISREPVEEDIELPNISLNKGTNIVEVQTNIKPSKNEYQYYKGGK